MPESINPQQTTACAICDRVIIGNDAFAMPGDMGHRHRKCGPGSKAWLAKFPDQENNPIGKLLARRAKPPKPPKVYTPADLTRRHIKEFLGRIKYMLYMDTKNNNPIGWRVETTINGRDLTFKRGDQPLDPEVLYEQLTK